MDTYMLLSAFRSVFDGAQYRHRSSTVGDRIAGYLYEDLFTLARSPAFVRRVRGQTHGTNRRNLASGLPMRRGDGVLGELVPGVERKTHPEREIVPGALATIEIGCEVKILAKAMIKQIDRVMSDITRQAEHFRKYGRPICVGFVGINSAAICTSYEGDRAFRTNGSGGFVHPCDEAPEAERRIRERAVPAFDHFIFLRYRATNEPPYAFEWVNAQQTFEEYGALLTRLAIDYEQRFP